MTDLPYRSCCEQTHGRLIAGKCPWCGQRVFEGPRRAVRIPCTVRSLAEDTGIPVARMLDLLRQLGITSDLNDPVDPELLQKLADMVDVEIDMEEEDP